MTDSPRDHHYLFAHRVLPSSLTAIAANALRLAAAGRLDATLRGVWNDVGEGLPPEERLAADGLTGELTSAGGVDVLLVTLPRPERMTEAYYAAVVLTDPPRYLVLEHSVSVMTGEPMTVLGGWDADRHLNLGDGPPPERDAFLAAVAERL